MGHGKYLSRLPEHAVVRRAGLKEELSLPPSIFNFSKSKNGFGSQAAPARIQVPAS
jgi:hypothetical protein